MIVATHQPIFLPWPGFFFKARLVDRFVLLDQVQFPLGRGWVNRNRIKGSDGVRWLTVPVRKKGRAGQKIADVVVCGDRDWRRTHLTTIEHCYGKAPYFQEYYPALASIYREAGDSLLALNLELIRLFWDALSLPGRPLLQSELGVGGGGTELIVDVCRTLGAKNYVNFAGTEKHFDEDTMKAAGIACSFVSFRPPVYPQLWGEFVYNLSLLDMLMNCGPKSGEIVARAGGGGRRR